MGCKLHPNAGHDPTYPNGCERCAEINYGIPHDEEPP
jgi:hypothetical protein